MRKIKERKEEGMEVKTLYYEDLPEEIKDSQPNNGVGKEYAQYLAVTFEGQPTKFFSDAMQPEDATFIRDLEWIADLVRDAYEAGKNAKDK